MTDDKTVLAIRGKQTLVRLAKVLEVLAKATVKDDPVQLQYVEFGPVGSRLQLVSADGDRLLIAQPSDSIIELPPEYPDERAYFHRDLVRLLCHDIKAVDGLGDLRLSFETRGKRTPGSPTLDKIEIVPLITWEPYTNEQSILTIEGNPLVAEQYPNWHDVVPRQRINLGHGHMSYQFLREATDFAKALDAKTGIRLSVATYTPNHHMGDHPPHVLEAKGAGWEGYMVIMPLSPTRHYRPIEVLRGERG